MAEEPGTIVVEMVGQEEGNVDDAMQAVQLLVQAVEMDGNAATYDPETGAVQLLVQAVEQQEGISFSEDQQAAIIPEGVQLLVDASALQEHLDHEVVDPNDPDWSPEGEKGTRAVASTSSGNTTSSTAMQKVTLDNADTPRHHCTDCSMTFMSNISLQKHLLTHTHTDRDVAFVDHYNYFTCKLCNRNYLSRKALHKHIRIVHGGVEWQKVEQKLNDEAEASSNADGVQVDKLMAKVEGSSSEAGERKAEKEKDVEKTVEEKQIEIIAAQARRDGFVLRCGECDRIYPTKSSLKKHMLLTHRLEKQDTKADNKYACGQCNKTYRSENGLARHLVQTHLIRDAVVKAAAASDDEEESTQESNSSTPVNVNPDNTPTVEVFICGICDLECTTTEILMEHMRTAHEMDTFTIQDSETTIEEYQHQFQPQPGPSTMPDDPSPIPGESEMVPMESSLTGVAQEGLAVVKEAEPPLVDESDPVKAPSVEPTNPVEEQVGPTLEPEPAPIESTLTIFGAAGPTLENETALISEEEPITVDQQPESSVMTEASTANDGNKVEPTKMDQGIAESSEEEKEADNPVEVPVAGVEDVEMNDSESVVSSKDAYLSSHGLKRNLPTPEENEPDSKKTKLSVENYFQASPVAGDVSCGPCGKVFAHAYSLNRHLQSPLHKKTLQEKLQGGQEGKLDDGKKGEGNKDGDDGSESDPESTECKTCGSSYANHKGLLRHYGTKLHQEALKGPGTPQEASDSAKDGDDEEQEEKLDCDVCGISFRSPFALNRHYSRQVHKDAVERSKNPQPDFEDDGEEEVDENDENDRFECKICGTYYTTRKHLVRHYDTQLHKDTLKARRDAGEEEPAGSIALTCILCNTSYTSEHGLQRHYLTQLHKDAVYEASLKARRTEKSKVGVLTRVKKKEPAKFEFLCKTCNRTYPFKYTYEQHLESQGHKNAVRAAFQNEARQKSKSPTPECEGIMGHFVCEPCGTSYSERKSLLRHFQSPLHKSKLPVEPIVPYSPKILETVAKKTEASTPVARPVPTSTPKSTPRSSSTPTSTGKFKCEVCKTYYRSMNHLNRHYTTFTHKSKAATENEEGDDSEAEASKQTGDEQVEEVPEESSQDEPENPQDDSRDLPEDEEATNNGAGDEMNASEIPEKIPQDNEDEMITEEDPENASQDKPKKTQDDSQDIVAEDTIDTEVDADRATDEILEKNSQDEFKKPQANPQKTPVREGAVKIVVDKVLEKMGVTSTGKASLKPTSSGKFKCEVCNTFYSSINHLTRHFLTITHRTLVAQMNEGDKQRRGEVSKQSFEQVIAEKTYKDKQKEPSRDVPQITPKVNQIVYAPNDEEMAAESSDKCSQDEIVRGQLVYPCEICGKCYQNVHGLNRHLQKFHPGGDKNGGEGKSKVPEKTYNDGPGEFQCDLCDRVYRYTRGLKEHRQKVHNEGVTPKSENHAWREENEDGFVCQVCDKTFPFKFSLEKHMKRSHDLGTADLDRSLSATPHSSNKKKAFYPCDMCSMAFRYDHMLIRHQFEVHKDGNILVETGDGTAEVLHVGKDLSEHNHNRLMPVGVRKPGSQNQQDDEEPMDVDEEEMRQGSNRKDDTPGRHACDECERVYLYERGLKRHKMSLHSPSAVGRPQSPGAARSKSPVASQGLDSFAKIGENLYPCGICDKVLLSKTTWRRHRMSHSPEEIKRYESKQSEEPLVEEEGKVRQSYPCKECGKVYMTMQSLKHHLSLHHRIENPKAYVRDDPNVPGGKVFECKPCGKVYPRLFHLQKHLESSKHVSIVGVSVGDLSQVVDVKELEDVVSEPTETEGEPEEAMETTPLQEAVDTISREESSEPTEKQDEPEEVLETTSPQEAENTISRRESSVDNPVPSISNPEPEATSKNENETELLMLAPGSGDNILILRQMNKDGEQEDITVVSQVNADGQEEFVLVQAPSSVEEGPDSTVDNTVVSQVNADGQEELVLVQAASTARVDAAVDKSINVESAEHTLLFNPLEEEEEDDMQEYAAVVSAANAFDNEGKSQDSTESTSALKPPPSSYDCGICGKKYNWKWSMKRHMLQTHFIKKANSGSLRKDEEEENPYRCELCNSSYAQPHNLNIHIQRCHTDSAAEFGVEVVESEEFDTAGTTFMCEGCHGTFVSLEDFQKHTCDQEDTGDRNKSPFPEESENQGDGSLTVLCELCAVVFPSLKSWQSHECVEQQGEGPIVREFVNAEEYMSEKANEEKSMNAVEEIQLNLSELAEAGELQNVTFDELADAMAVQNALEELDENLDKMERSHNEKAPFLFPCSFCERWYPSKAMLIKHAQDVHVGKHLEVRKKSSEFACDLCNNSYKYKRGLAEHVKEHPSEFDPYIIEDQRRSALLKDPTEFLCHICGIVSISKDSLRHHLKFHLIREVNQGDDFLCELCGIAFESKKEKTQHLKKHKADNVIWACTECPKTFPTHRTALIQTHINSHTGDKPFECHLCGKKLLRMCHLKTHLKKHESEKTIYVYECGECGKRFRQRSHLKVHIMSHNGEKPHECSDCGKRFLMHSHMKYHQKTVHADVRPANFTCTQCGQVFVHRHHYKTHLMRHSGEKPYECDRCGKRFIQRSHLKTHIMTHTGEKPHVCEFCNKRFLMSSHLKSHILSSHTGEKIIECNVCGRKCTSHAQFKIHMKMHPPQSQLPPRKYRISAQEWTNPLEVLSSIIVDNNQYSSTNIVPMSESSSHVEVEVLNSIQSIVPDSSSQVEIASSIGQQMEEPVEEGVVERGNSSTITSFQPGSGAKIDPSSCILIIPDSGTKAPEESGFRIVPEMNTEDQPTSAILISHNVPKSSVTLEPSTMRGAYIISESDFEGEGDTEAMSVVENAQNNDGQTSIRIVQSHGDMNSTVEVDPEIKINPDEVEMEQDLEQEQATTIRIVDEAGNLIQETTSMNYIPGQDAGFYMAAEGQLAVSGMGEGLDPESLDTKPDVAELGAGTSGPDEGMQTVVYLENQPNEGFIDAAGSGDQENQEMQVVYLEEEQKDTMLMKEETQATILEQEPLKVELENPEQYGAHLEAAHIIMDVSDRAVKLEAPSEVSEQTPEGGN